MWLKSARSAAVIRIIGLVIGVTCSTVVGRIVFDALGAPGYGVVSLVATLGMLIPFADLGLGAPVMNAVARACRDGGDGRAAAPLLGHILFTLLRPAAAVVGISIALGLFGVWGRMIPIRGEGSAEINVTLAVAGALIGLGIPAGIGYRILVGMNRTHIAVGVGALTSPLALIGTAVVNALHPSLLAFALCVPVASLATSHLVAVIAFRRSGLSLRTLARARPTVDPGDALAARGQSRSMLVVSIAAPVAMQSDRLILSALSSPTELARYALAAQVAAPLLNLISTAATPLWPILVSIQGWV